MQFDVIIGNPPYQRSANGGPNTIPIYNKFVDQAKKMNPRFLSMLIPSRWMTSGRSLSEFRRAMLEDRRIRMLVDYPIAREVFPEVEISGGVCYFFWDRNAEGDCAVAIVRGGEVDGPVSRNLGEYDVFVRDSRAIEILRKVQSRGEPSIIEILSVNKEFGWTSNFNGFHDTRKPDDVAAYYIRNAERKQGWISRSAIKKSYELVDTWKVMITEAYGDGGAIPCQIFSQPFVAPSPSICTQSYLFFYVNDKDAAESLESYLRTRFFRFLVYLRKITHHAPRSTYTWVPQQPWDRIWTDEELYRKYGLTDDDIEFIKTRVRLQSLDIRCRRIGAPIGW